MSDAGKRRWARFAELVKPRLTADDVFRRPIEAKGITIKKEQAANWSCRCPIHEGSGESFSVCPGDMAWKCHSASCNLGGGPVEFWAALYCGTNEEARDRLAGIVGVDLDASPAPKEDAGPATLGEASALLDALSHTRKLRRDILEGYWGVRPAIHGRDKVRPAILFPAPGLPDRVRYLDGELPKAKWAAAGGSGGLWYGLGPALEHLEHGGTMYFVNGEPSVWACYQAGVPAVCSCLGEGKIPTKDATDELVEALTQRGASLAIVFDLDKAGVDGAKKVAELLDPYGLRLRALQLPKEQLGTKGDVDDLHRLTGDAGLADALRNLHAIRGVVLSTEVDKELRWTTKRGANVFDVSQHNLSVLLRKHPDMPFVWHNDFSHLNYVRVDEAADPSREVTDRDFVDIKEWISSTYGGEFAKGSIADTVDQVARERGRNPLIEWLDSCRARWDGYMRLGSWLAAVLGSGTDDEIVGVYGRKYLISAVARVYEPGCKADPMLVISGPQGAGKSTLFRILAGDEYYGDTPVNLDDKDRFTALNEVWFCEIAELSSFRKAEAEKIKSFVSGQHDRFRPAYGRCMVKQKRHSVFVGTTNEEAFLRDPTGNRRFWCVRCAPKIDLDWAREHREQLWGEAVAAYEDIKCRGTDYGWWLDDDRELALHEASIQEFEHQDPLEGKILETVAGRTEVNAADVEKALRDELGPVLVSKYASTQIAQVLKKAGWKTGKRQRRAGSNPVRLWTSPEMSRMTVLKGGSESLEKPAERRPVPVSVGSAPRPPWQDALDKWS